MPLKTKKPNQVSFWSHSIEKPINRKFLEREEKRKRKRKKKMEKKRKGKRKEEKRKEKKKLIIISHEKRTLFCSSLI